MRFAAVKCPTPPRMPAAELIHRLVTGQRLAPPRPEPQRPPDLPADLDQRVRLIGEW